jgi:hypothetical protein
MNLFTTYLLTPLLWWGFPIKQTLLVWCRVPPGDDNQLITVGLQNYPKLITFMFAVPRALSRIHHTTKFAFMLCACFVNPLRRRGASTYPYVEFCVSILIPLQKIEYQYAESFIASDSVVR